MLPTYESLKIKDLTPIEEYGGILYKRDDLYTPFSDIPLSGGKVRQACSLVLDNYEHIKNDCDGLIATPCALSSPQGIIIARVAKEFGFRSLILHGATKRSTLGNHPLAIHTLYLGAKLNIESKLGYDSALQSHLKNKMKQGLKCFNVKFGINLNENPESIIKSIGNQVENIPDTLDILIIPCGSAITACGILWGLKYYNKSVKQIYLIQISGYSRLKVIDEASKVLGMEFPPFEFVIDKTYKYNKHVRLPFGGGHMDPIYEGKAFDYMKKHIDVKDKKVLFWIIGDSQPIRDSSIEITKDLLSKRQSG
jgi:1-aminocyclopropane-1-carboxylate deaminase/D-cysteine desulfhydrase-like pyridoxal-dependent ACC family enzyme